MITHKFKCEECGKVVEIDFATMAERDKLEPALSHDCGGALVRYWGGGKAPGIKTASSPNRY